VSRSLVVPDLSLVVLIGCSGSGKSTFARQHFLPTEVLSSDACRGLVSDDENDQAATGPAFEVLHFIAGKRLEAGKRTVVDATNVQAESRRSLVALARQYHVIPTAIVLDLPPRVCHARNASRSDRTFGPHVVRQQHAQLAQGLRKLKEEGFRHVHVLSTEEDVATATIRREKLWNDRRDDHGPFDIIGDVHGCHDELVELLGRLGYAVGGTPDAPEVVAPPGRKVVFLGDIIDRGPGIAEALRLVMSMVKAGIALCVPGNHEMKLLRKLRGKDVKLTHGLAETVAQLEPHGPAFGEEVAAFIDDLVSHYVLDDGKLVVAHAGLRQELQGRGSGVVRQFCLYGETTGETDSYGLPVRYDWASEYRGPAAVVYGHTPVPTPEWINRTMCVDTGCVYGGALSALRWPEREIVQVEARRTYWEPARPLEAEVPARGTEADLLEYEDVSGKRVLSTRYGHTVTVRATHVGPALEIMSRFAVDPRWIVYLPPTMSPPATAPEGPLLERPAEAFHYFRQQGVTELVCEEKHMGSRAVLVVARDVDAATRRFGVHDGRAGVVYTRTGRPFFSNESTERTVVDHTRAAFERAGLWSELETDWVVLDAELMPWSHKAIELLRSQYAAVATAGTTSLDAAVGALAACAAPGAELLRERYVRRRDAVQAFREAYRRYCWDVTGTADLRIAPFHLLASEGRVSSDRPHAFHLGVAAQLSAADPLFMATRHVDVDLADELSVAAATAWWEELTGGGGEGMVVKPRAFLARGPKGLVQPAIKCRGREYLRLIYGPESTAPEHLERLRGRNLHVKRGLALRELTLGLEALHRFVEREPLHRVHECVFGVLALETEPVDPRL
jgi:protein phosphatase